MDWNQDNIITKAMGKELYNTDELLRLFKELDKDGFSRISLGLIIDLIRARRDGLMIVEYDCWKCGIWHEVTFDSMEQIERFVSESGASVRNVNTLELILEGSNNA